MAGQPRSNRPSAPPSRRSPAATLGEYLKLARSFNMALTGVAPVLAAIAMGERDLLRMSMLFGVGVGAHIYGFVLNDYVDARIDRATDELSERPLVSGSISPRAALAFALGGLAMMLLLGLLLLLIPGLGGAAGPPDLSKWTILVAASLSATLYNLVSKKTPGMDVFVAGAVLLLCLFGAAITSPEPGLRGITLLGWVVVLLGFLQVMFMNIVAGGLKDIDHDARAGGKTLAVATGATVRKDGTLVIPLRFKAIAQVLQGAHLAFVGWAFAILAPCATPAPLQVLVPPNATNIATCHGQPAADVLLILVVLIVLGALMLRTSVRLLGMRTWDRNAMRKSIGLHYTLNYALVPIVLAVAVPWTAILVIVPPAGFLLSNLGLHGGALRPETM